MSEKFLIVWFSQKTCVFVVWFIQSFFSCLLMSVWRLMDWFTNWWRILTAKKRHSILHYVRFHIVWLAGQVVSAWTLHCLGNDVMPIILLQKWHLLIWKYGPIFCSSNAWFYLIMFMKYADGCLEWVTVKRVLQLKQNTSQYIYWEL